MPRPFEPDACAKRPCEVERRWAVVDTHGRQELGSCDLHLPFVIRRRVSQLGLGAQVVVRPLFPVAEASDLAALVALRVEVYGLVGIDGLPPLIADASEDVMRSAIQAFGGRAHE